MVYELRLVGHCTVWVASVTFQTRGTKTTANNMPNTLGVHTFSCLPNITLRTSYPTLFLTSQILTAAFLASTTRRVCWSTAPMCVQTMFSCAAPPDAPAPSTRHRAQRPLGPSPLPYSLCGGRHIMFSLKHGSLLPCGSSSEYLNKPSTTHSDCTRTLQLFQAPETRDGKENDNDPDWPTVLRPTFSPIRDAKSETHVTCIGFLRETTKETECSTLQPHLHVTLKTWRFQNGRCKKKVSLETQTQHRVGVQSEGAAHSHKT